MGYTTYFSGAFTILPTLMPAHRAYLAAFAEIRHMKRDISRLAALPDPIRDAVLLPLGVEGEFYIGPPDQLTSDKDETILRDNGTSRSTFGNTPPDPQPGLWCQWAPSEDGTTLEWDQGEKFYEYVEWLKYLVTNFLDPWGYLLEGEISWSGEDDNDRGVIYAHAGQIEAVEDEVTNRGPAWAKKDDT